MNMNSNDLLENFEATARIVVIGVGGAGNNAVNRMIEENITSVEFYVMNTDMQTLANSRANNRLILGQEITEGLGAGGDPEIGRKAAEASAEQIREIVTGAKMVFIAAGMGGGTGTGAAPVIAQIAKDCGALTVAIVTRPFTFEGKKRISYSVEGLNSLKAVVDAIILVSNDKLLLSNGNRPINEAFSESDRVLAQSVKTVTDLILMPAIINLDFADVKSTLKDSGIALIGFGMGQGPKKAQDAAFAAINSPLLETSIAGAKRAICSVTCGTDVSLFEAQNCINFIIEAAGGALEIKFGISVNDQLSDQLIVSIIASDFAQEFDFTSIPQYSNNDFISALNSKPKQIEETEIKDVTDEDSSHILPSFLKDKHL